MVCNSVRSAAVTLTTCSGPNEVSSPLANVLIVRAQEIIDWVEAFLPENARRPKSTTTVELSLLKMFVAPAAPQAETPTIA